ncbi:hypothetical protein [Trichlorobacter ammonificans]|uniref:Uncharacterized protein n=1 Tax=Trichlorobacter ammonificans TaxID=2916410 RepID=A0ABM9D5G8_9BACT|nr:hypothetical protein [Trichlorobacter ammonificans]CAH2030118.1 conserved protein of unknown function [Trichlorobacter ammonificans]
MKRLHNTKGVALVTSLMLTLISLTIILALMYMIVQGTTVSASYKKYRTSLEASYGGSELFVKDLLPYVLKNYQDSNLAALAGSTFSAVNLQLLSTASCIQSKLTLPSSQWPAGCSNTADPKQSPDATFNLMAASGSPYTIYSKIIETLIGNTDISGLQLEGAGVAEAQSGITPQHFPYLYRIELQGERSATAKAQANIEVLYAY